VHEALQNGHEAHRVADVLLLRFLRLGRTLHREMERVIGKAGRYSHLMQGETRRHHQSRTSRHQRSEQQ
jgi:hypothetical protein